MPFDYLTAWVTSALLLGLRLAPILAFAPPFTLVRMPRLIRMLMGLGLSTCLIAGHPEAILNDISLGAAIVGAARELAIGLYIVLVFQIVFGALNFAGRTVDVQAGFGLSMVIDPGSRSQTALTGTLFAYAAGLVFFAMDGHLELFRFLSASVDAVPVGGWVMPSDIGPLLQFMSVTFVVALGVAGFAILALFLTDVVIALLSRTVPQMNVLVMGFQVKTLVFLLVLPMSFGVGGAVLFRMLSRLLEMLPRLL